LLDLFADGIANARVLLLVNYRPEYRHEWGGKSYYIQLRLDPLGRQGAGEMLATLLGNSVELDPLKRMVIERTEGNPFFIEEMVQALFDEGVLVPGTVKITRPLSQVRIPATVQGILASRIDRLPAPHKDLLQTLSVLGKNFPLDLVKAVAPMPEDDLARMLSGLQLGEFVYEQPGLTNIELTFKHALTQEVAYNSLLMERRKLLHERAGEAIEGLFHDRLEDHVGELAHHYSRSLNSEKALTYLQAAGVLASQRSANAQAADHFNTALGLLFTLPDTHERAMQELDLQTKLGPVVMALKGHASPEAARVYARARELCQRLGETAQLFPVLWGSWFVSTGDDFETARDLAHELLALARRVRDPALLLEAHHALWMTLIFRGEIVSGREHAERGAALYQAELHRPHALLYGGHDPGVCCRFLGAPASWLLGYPEQAVQKIREALALAQELRHPHTTVMALTWAAILHQLRGEVLEAGERAEASVRISAEHGFAVWTALGAFLLSWARAEHGLAEHEIAQMRQDLADVEATRTELFRAQFLGLMAKRLGETGRTEAGLELVVEALDAVKNGVRWYEAELYRIKGELLLERNSTDAASAEESFRTAIGVARRQSAKSLELRATTSLARLLAKEDKRDEACAMLAEIYGWFTEGFDTADLKDAKAQLDQLNA
jgi:predicted ATPase